MMRLWRRLWPRYQFSPSLDQSLIAAMEDEARWMISNGLTPEKQVPDFYELHLSWMALKTSKTGSGQHHPLSRMRVKRFKGSHLDLFGNRTEE